MTQDAIDVIATQLKSSLDHYKSAFLQLKTFFESNTDETIVASRGATKFILAWMREL